MDIESLRENNTAGASIGYGANANHCPRLAALTPATGKWRIDWLGSVSFPDRSRSAYQPSMEVLLSKVESDARFEAKTFQRSQQIRSMIRIGYLPLLRVGSIWEDGVLLDLGDDKPEVFREVDVQRETSRLLKAGSALPGLDQRGEAFVLPLAEHPWHKDYTHSYCILIDLLDGRRLVVPCSELIRFYFGSSSSLATRLFRPPISEEMFFLEPHLQGCTGQAQLTLAEGIFGASAADVARIAFNRLAWTRAVQIGTSILRAHASGAAPYPQCGFPFTGKTDLTVVGRWLSFDGKPESTFIVQQIVSCSHPFPFSSLRYQMEGRKGTQPAKGDDASAKRKVARQSLPDDPSFQQSDPSEKLAKRTFRFDSKERFPDLVRKRVWKTESATSDHGDSMFLKGGTPEAFATGERGTGTRTAPAELVVPIRNKKLGQKRPPAFLAHIVELIDGLNGVGVELLTSDEDDGWTLPVPIVSDDTGEADCRCFRSAPEENDLLRRYALFAVSADEYRAMLFALQSRDGDGLVVAIFQSFAENTLLQPLLIGTLEALVVLPQPALMLRTNDLLQALKYSKSEVAMIAGWARLQVAQVTKSQPEVFFGCLQLP